MGDRYFLTVACKCGHVENDVWYAPTSGFMTFTCPRCAHVTNLETYSGINAEGTASTREGAESVRRQLRELKARGI